MASHHDYSAVFVAPGVSVVHVLGFNASDSVSRPFEAWVDVLCDDNVEDDKVIGAKAAIQFGHADEDYRTLVGSIESITAFGLPDSDGGRLFNYRFTLVHPLSLLAWIEDSQIFQDLTAPEIIKKILEQNMISGSGIELRLTATYLKREYCVQYNESVFAFISRLCEAEGIFYFSEVSDEGDAKLVFADDSSAAGNIKGEPEIKFKDSGGLDHAAEFLTEITARERMVSGKFVLRDFNLETPKVDLTSEAKGDKYDDLEVYDYPGGYADTGEGKRLAKVRLESEFVSKTMVDVETNSSRLAAGKIMKIADAEDADVADGEYFITGVMHRWERGAGGRGGAAALGGQQYRCTATLIPKKVKYRAPIVTAIPVIEGAQTATVVCQAGAAPQEIHTDEYGRCKLKFNWDRSAPTDDKASAWFRTGQMQTSGSQALPRLGWEVLVEFLEGDPDRPVVTGRVYNGTLMPPYALPEGKSRSSIQSSSSPGGEGKNEIRMEDKAGAEEIFIKSQYNTSMKAANNKSTNVGANETKNVGADAALTVGANQDVKITKGASSAIKGNQDVKVGAMRKVEVNAVTGLTVKGDASTTVGGMHYEMDGNPLEALIALAMSKAAEKLADKAAEAAEHVKGAVMGKVNQVLGPVNAVVGKAQALGAGMSAVANGNMGAAAGVLAGAAGLPGAGAMFGGGGGGGGGGGEGGHGGGGGGEGAHGGGGEGGGGGGVKPGLAATAHAGPGGKGSSAGGIAAKNYLTGKMTDAIQKGVRKAAKALAGGEGGDAEGGGGGSKDNAGGPKGDVDGIDEEDKEKGPGHAEHEVKGTITETVGGLKIAGVADGIMTNSKTFTENIGAARAEIVLGNRAESVEGVKNEDALGLIVVSRADETEAVGGMKMQMVGGAVAEKIGGGHSVDGGSMATFISAFHKVEAGGKITFKVGGSEVVVDDAGITINAPIIMVLASKIELPKAATEV
jgi:type VI secretion system secreted protein VgrG